MNNILSILVGGEDDSEGTNMSLIITWIVLAVVTCLCIYLMITNTTTQSIIASETSAIIEATNKANQAMKAIADINTNVESSNKTIAELSDNNSKYKRNNYLYYPEDAIIYQNIFDALKNKVIAKSGDPAHWDETTYAVNPWNNFLILRIGLVPGGTKGFVFPNGLKVTVPENKNVLWVRALGDRWTCIQLFKADGTYLFTYATGYNNLNRYAPDGGSADAGWNVHPWMAMPVPGPGDYVLVAGNKANDGGGDLWLSGIAFSTNPLNHAYNSIIAYHWLINGGSPALTWNSENWNNDQLAQLDHPKVYTLIVPIVPSGKDKLLYIIEHNNQWNGIMHKSVTVEGQPVERFRSTVSHPLATHHNSKIYERFISTRIPEALTRGKTFITVVIDMTLQNHNIYCREIGTIDIN